MPDRPPFDPRRRQFFKLAALTAASLTLLPTRTSAEPPAPTASPNIDFGPSSANLRGYGAVTIAPLAAKQIPGATAYRVTCSDPAHALLFASKLLSDYQVLKRNKIAIIPTRTSSLQAIQAPEGWAICPIVRAGDPALDVICASSLDAVKKTVTALNVSLKTVVAISPSGHPLYMDKWDRYCFGFWCHPSDAEAVVAFRDAVGKPDPDQFYAYMKKIGVVLQGANYFSLKAESVDATSYHVAEPYLRKYGIPLQFAAWLPVDYDLYNRSPLSASGIAPGFTPITSYYGDAPYVPSVLEDVQNASYLAALKQSLSDSMMTILEPHGEAGPFPYMFQTFQSPEGLASLVRFLRDERQYTLPTLSKRWFGHPNALASWNDLRFPDLRAFYGWSPESAQDLGGAWKTHEDTDRKGEAAGWTSPDFDDHAWREVRMPGDETTNFRKGAAWYRIRFDAAPKLRSAGKVYASIISLNHGWRDNPGLVYLNGVKIGEIKMRAWYTTDFGQFDTAPALKPTGNVLAILTSQGSMGGPVFLTTKPMEDFPTSNPKVNLQKVDYNDWIAYAVGTAMGRSMSYIRAVAPDQAAKFHAVESEWAERAMQKYGGFPHCTGEGAFWRPYFKHYGIPRGLQDSSEPGGSARNLAELKNLFATMWMEGMNAHDYFHDPQSILNDPDQRAYFEQMLPYMKLMGCMNIKPPQIALFSSRRSPRYQGEWKAPGQADAAPIVMNLQRGFVYVDEATIEDRLIAPYPVLIDNSTECWDEALTADLTAYVQNGGTLVLTTNSGRHTYRDRDAWPSSALTGCRVTGEHAFPATDRQSISFAPQAAPFTSLANGSLLCYNSKNLPIPLAQTNADVQILARFATDHAPAIVRRAVGKGQVVWVIAPDSIRDKAVLGPLLDGLNVPANAISDSWTESFISNDGTESLLVQTNMGKEDRSLALTWQPGFTPAKVYDPVTGDPIPARAADAKAVLNPETLGPKDLRFAAARRPVSAAEAFEHWWTRQTQIWQGTTPPATLAPHPLLRTIDLSHGDRTKQSAVHSETFRIPAGWQTAGTGFTLLLSGPNGLDGLPGGGALQINGQKIADIPGVPGQGIAFDITDALRPGDNVYSLTSTNPAAVCNCAITLERTVAPEQRINLAGEWRGCVSEEEETAVTLPGSFSGVYVYRDYAAPSDLAGKDVWIQVETKDSNSSAWVSVNGRVRYMSYFGSRSQGARPLEINITPDLIPGQTNRILIGTTGFAHDEWTPVKHVYTTLSLCVYDRKDWGPISSG